MAEILQSKKHFCPLSLEMDHNIQKMYFLNHGCNHSRTNNIWWVLPWSQIILCEYKNKGTHLCINRIKLPYPFKEIYLLFIHAQVWIWLPTKNLKSNNSKSKHINFFCQMPKHGILWCKVTASRVPKAGKGYLTNWWTFHDKEFKKILMYSRRTERKPLHLHPVHSSCGPHMYKS